MEQGCPNPRNEHAIAYEGAKTRPFLHVVLESMSDHPPSSFLNADLLLSELLSTHQACPPEILYHYTSAAGLKGMLDSRVIWASHFEYTNDAEEVNYGIKLAFEHLQRLDTKANVFASREHFNDVLLNKRNDVPARNLLVVLAAATVLQMERKNTSGYEFFFACFSEQGDVLSQWRAYASDAKGYSVGIKVGSILNEENGSLLAEGDTLDCFQVIYDPARQTAIIDDVVQRVADGFAESMADIEVSERQEALISFNVYLASCIQRLALIFKHPGFAEESEWRVIHTKKMTAGAHRRDDGLPPKSRVRDGSLVPYTEIPLRSESGSAIRKVILGPKNGAKGERLEPDFALKSLVGPDVEIRRSLVPYR